MKSKLFLFLYFLQFISSGAVCDLRLLQMELRQDLEDNGILDCLRVIDPPYGVNESPQDKNKRLAAQWDTDCSFEATYDWMA
jgi:hypothetical protein